MKGYCGHITHLSVVSDFDILIFCLFISFLVCLYIVLCWFCKRNMVQSFWRTITFCIFVKTIHFQHQQGWGSQKYFWCLDLFTCKFIQERFLNSSPKIFSLNFECYFSLSVKKMPSVMSKAFRRGSRYQIGWIFGKNPNMPSSKCVLFWFFSIQFLKK